MPNETLLSESTVLLFGRPISDLTLDPTKHTGSTGAVADVLKDPKASLARIYSFSYQNEFFDLASPALFVVREKGKPVAGTLQDSLLSRIKGLVATDLEYWAFDREDFSVRLDVMTGSIARILLDYELAEEGLQDFVRGGNELGQPSQLSGRRGRGRRWRSNDE